MAELLKEALSYHELSALSSIVQVGDATYRELMEDRYPMFRHPYFSDTRGRIRTKLVQIQCEIESHDPNFPFIFSERTFAYNYSIPELRTDNVILHLARSMTPDTLPPKARYKTLLSHNNSILCRQLAIDTNSDLPTALAPFYGIVVFGGREELFITVQFPMPGYLGIADYITIPQILIEAKSSATESFERKKAELKKEFLAQDTGEVS